MLNRVILIGRLTADPAMRYTPNGTAVATFTLAVENPFKTEEPKADFIPIVTWKQLAETCANYLKKGRLTAVEGRIQVRSYENNESKRVYITEIVADNVRFLESGNRENSQEGQRSAGTAQGNKTTSGGSRNESAGGGDPFSDDGRPLDISESDLPFF